MNWSIPLVFDFVLPNLSSILFFDVSILVYILLHGLPETKPIHFRTLCFTKKNFGKYGDPNQRSGKIFHLRFDFDHNTTYKTGDFCAK